MAGPIPSNIVTGNTERPPNPSPTPHPLPTLTGLDLRSSSLLSMLPWAAMAGGASLAGGLAEMLLARGWPRRRMRCGIQSLAFLGPLVALAVLAGGGSRLSIPVAVGAMTAALGITSLGQAGFVGAVGDVAPAAAGKLFGLCNTFGTLAGVAGVQGRGGILWKGGVGDAPDGQRGQDTVLDGVNGGEWFGIMCARPGGVLLSPGPSPSLPLIPHPSTAPQWLAS